MKRSIALVPFLLTGCGRYAEFTLQPLSGPQGKVDATWSVRPDPVMARDKWVDLLNPSVVAREGSFFNVYSAYDGKVWHSGLAISTDGITWKDQGIFLSPEEGDYIAANGSALNGRYWYQTGRVPQIRLATQRDGKWTRHPEPVLTPGPRGSWDERGVADPYVIRQHDTYYMYFLGQDRARRQRLGVARSTDGMRWEKLRSNPILELGGPKTFDEIGLGEPAIWSQHGSYWMLYTGRDRFENRRLGLARSSDGTHWARVTDKPVLEGSQRWDSKVVCDPSVMVQGNVVRVWFGGGDKAEPAENLNGQIGYAELTLTIRQ